MVQRVQFIEGVVVEVSDIPTPADQLAEQANEEAADKASVRGFFRNAAAQAQCSLTDSMAVLGQVASAFSKSLTNSDHRPNLVEISFGLEATGEAGNFIISKVGGKANFSVKMTWKADA